MSDSGAKLQVLLTFDGDGKLIDIFPVVETDAELKALQTALAPLLERAKDADNDE